LLTYELNLPKTLHYDKLSLVIVTFIVGICNYSKGLRAQVLPNPEIPPPTTAKNAVGR